MNPWKDTYYKGIYTTQTRGGLSLHFDCGISPDLRYLFIDFSKWLRKHYQFPVHVNVYIKNCEKIMLLDKTEAYGGFRYFKQESAYIRIAAKAEMRVLQKYSLHDVYEMILSTLVHELTHYFQWINRFDQSDAESERQANYYRYRILNQYLLDSGSLDITE